MHETDAPTVTDVERFSNRVAHGLRRRIGGGSPTIGLQFSDEARLAVAILGVLKAGAHPVVLGPLGALAPDGDAGDLQLVITDRGAADSAFALAGPQCVVVVDDALVEGAPEGAPPPPVPLDPPPPIVVHQRLDAHGDGDVLQLQEGRTDRWPLFVLHDLDGRANRYRRLAIELGDDQPVYAVESPFLAGYPVPLHDAAALAERLSLIHI